MDIERCRSPDKSGKAEKGIGQQSRSPKASRLWRPLASVQREERKAMKEVSVLLVEDHAIVRQGLRLILEQEPDIRVVGEAKSSEEA